MLDGIKSWNDKKGIVTKKTHNIYESVAETSAATNPGDSM
jgi:hypothetical protein